MIKFLFVGRRAPGTTRAAAQAHLRDVHGRMVVLPPADAGALPAYYAQNHVLDGAYPAGGGAQAIDRDLVTEVQFESLDAMRAAVSTPYYLANLQPDEPLFVDNDSVVRLPVAPRVIVTGARTRFKLFLFVSRAEDCDDAGWDAARTTITAAMERLPGLAAFTENLAGPPAGGGPRFTDVVFEAWFDDRAAAEAGARVPTLLGLDAPGGDHVIRIVAEEYTEERLRTLLA